MIYNKHYDNWQCLNMGFNLVFCMPQNDPFHRENLNKNKTMKNKWINPLFRQTQPKLSRINTYMYSTMHIYDPLLITEAFLQVPPSVLHSTSFLGGNLQVGGGQTCSSPPAITTPNTWEQTEHGKPKACSCKKKSMLS